MQTPRRPAAITIKMFYDTVTHSSTTGRQTAKSTKCVQFKQGRGFNTAHADLDHKYFASSSSITSFSRQIFARSKLPPFALLSLQNWN